MSDAHGVVRRLEGDSHVMVEILDKVEQAESSEPQVAYPDERGYAVVEILSNGWVRCEGDSDLADENDDLEGVDVQYFPPERVNGIYASTPNEVGDA